MTESVNPTPDEASATPDEASDASTASSRRPMWLSLIAVAVVLVLAGGAALMWQTTREPDPAITPPPVTVTNPAPTPAITPIAKESGSDFYNLLPDTVRQYALMNVKVIDPPKASRSLESVTLTYSDGDGLTGDRDALTVTATRWETTEQAAKHAADHDAAAAKAHPDAPLTESPVDVDGTAVGTALQRLGEVEGQITWTNGTSVLTVSGPVINLLDFYTAFPV